MIHNEIMHRLQLSRRTPIRDLHMAFQILFIYDYITKLCSKQAEVIENHDNENVRNIEQVEARHRKYKSLNLATVRHTTDQMTKISVIALSTRNRA
jgi:hypothetical protein